MRAWGVAAAAALVGMMFVQGAAAKAPEWLTVHSSALNYQFGETYAQQKPHQATVGRVRLDKISRVSSVVIHGKRRTGDLLILEGRYENLTSQPTYWTEGYAFVFGTSPKLCTFKTCGPLPKGRWGTLVHGFGTAIVDYPSKGKVPAHSTVAFREAVPMPAVSQTGRLGSLSQIWLLPVYAAFNYYELPYPYSQLVRLSTYFGRETF